MVVDEKERRGVGGQALAADDAGDDAEADKGREVEEDGHRDQVSAKAVPRLDHLAQAGARAQGPQEGGKQRSQHADEDDDE